MNDKIIIVGINEVKISTDENPIIGTVGLATCVGVLLYSEEHKKAIVAHVSSNCADIVSKTINYIDEYKLYSSPLKYKIILGSQKNKYNISKILENFYSSCPKYFVPFEKNFENEVEVSLGSHQFAFDAKEGNFVSDRIFSNDENSSGERIK